MKLSFCNIEKHFGRNQVLNHLSFDAKSGTALGLLGRNGAGKTTLIRILLGIIKANEGEIYIDDQPINRSKISFGYLPEERGLYPKKQILNQLCYIGMLKGLNHSQAMEQSKKLLAKMRLDHLGNKKLETLSKGNQQKIQLAAALLGDPQILVLDEPFSGLDPVNAQLLKDIVREQAQSGKLVMFSSHQMSYVEEFCEQVLLLHKGNIILSGSLEEIKRSYPRNQIHIKIQDQRFLDFAQGCSYILKTTSQNNGSYIITLQNEQSKDELLESMVHANLFPEHFAIVEPSLEQIFVDKAGDEK